MNFVNITPENTVPTTGSDLVDLHVNGECLSLREVGSAMSSSWNKYIFTSQYILVRFSILSQYLHVYYMCTP